MADTRKPRPLRWVLPVSGVAALAVGIYAYSQLASVGTDSLERTSSTSPPVRPTRPAAGVGRRSSTSAAQPNASLRPRLQGSSDDGDEAPSAASHEVRVAEALRSATAAESAFVAEFETESVSGDWATTWEHRITDSLEHSLGQTTGFDGITVECRTQRCVGVATWASYDDATSALSKAANATKGKCATFVFMPPPDDPGRPYSHKLRFESCQPDPA